MGAYFLLRREAKNAKAPTPNNEITSGSGTLKPGPAKTGAETKASTNNDVSLRMVFS